MISFRRRWGKIPCLFFSILSGMGSQIPYPSTLTPGTKSGTVWRVIGAISTGSLDMIGEKYYNEQHKNRTLGVATVIPLELPNQAKVTLRCIIPNELHHINVPYFQHYSWNSLISSCVSWEILSLLCCEKYLFNIWPYLLVLSDHPFFKIEGNRESHEN
jgi:hypothetical protein